MEELAADFAAEHITRGELRASREVLERRLKRDRDALAKMTQTTALDGFTGTAEDLAERWEGLNVSQRRALVAAAIDRIVVHPADPRKRWDPIAFEVVWRA